MRRHLDCTSLFESSTSVVENRGQNSLKNRSKTYFRLGGENDENAENGNIVASSVAAGGESNTQFPDNYSKTVLTVSVIILQWVMFLILAIVLLVNHRNSDSPNSSSILPFPSMTRGIWMSWGSMLSAYKDALTQTNVPSYMKIKTGNQTLAYLTNLSIATMNTMQCNNMMVPTPLFTFNSPACACVYRVHKENITDPIMALPEGSNIDGAGISTKHAQAVLNQCIFAQSRTTTTLTMRTDPMWIESMFVVSSHELIAVQLNYFVALVGLAYLWLKNEKSLVETFGSLSVSFFVEAVLVLAVTVLMFLVIVLSFDKGAFFSSYTLILAVPLLLSFVMLFSVTGKQERAQPERSEKNKIKATVVFFWIHYAVTLPLLVVAHDVMCRQDRVVDYLAARVLQAVATALIAASCDVLQYCMNGRPSQSSKENTQTENNVARLSSFIAWSVCVFSIGVLQSGPMSSASVSVAASSSSSSSAVISVAYYVYLAMGIPLGSLAHINSSENGSDDKKDKYWKELGVTCFWRIFAGALPVAILLSMYNIFLHSLV